MNGVSQRHVPDACWQCDVVVISFAKAVFFIDAPSSLWGWDWGGGGGFEKRLTLMRYHFYADYIIVEYCVHIKLKCSSEIEKQRAWPTNLGRNFFDTVIAAKAACPLRHNFRQIFINWL